MDCILFSDALVAEGALMFAKACELGPEGIVSKRPGSRYLSGTSRQWLKSKNPAFVRGIGGTRNESGPRTCRVFRTLGEALWWDGIAKTEFQDRCFGFFDRPSWAKRAGFICEA